MEIIYITKPVTLSSGRVIDKVTYLELRKHYSKEKIAEDYGVFVDELKDKLGINALFKFDQDVDMRPEEQAEIWRDSLTDNHKQEEQ